MKYEIWTAYYEDRQISDKKKWMECNSIAKIAEMMGTSTYRVRDTLESKGNLWVTGSVGIPFNVRKKILNNK